MSTRTLSTTLPLGTLYVSGTVNGVATVWTNTSGQVWETEAARSEFDVYVVALTIIDSLGVSTQTQFTLYYGLHLVTDRTQADVDYVSLLLRKLCEGTITPAELVEWNSASLKGSYNASDLNRVGAAMVYLTERLNASGYITQAQPKIDWTEENVPTLEQMSQYLADVRSLRSALRLPADAPRLPESMEFLSYADANHIEEVLELVDTLLSNALAAAMYSGEIYAGEI